MNNSKIIEQVLQDEKPDITKMYGTRLEELAQIIEALEHINNSKYWKFLEEKVFDGVLDSLQKRIRSEKNPTEIYRLQGQIVWAEKYLDLKRMSQIFQQEISNIRSKLNEQNI